MTLYPQSTNNGNLRRLPLTLALIFTLTLSASAQQAAPDGWARVQVLPPGTHIRVNTATTHTRCILRSADASALICTQGKADVNFHRAGIQTIKVGRRGRSALVGAIPGAVLIAGGGITLGTEKCMDQFLCGLGAALVIGLGALLVIVGAGIGAATDFMGPTISLKP